MNDFNEMMAARDRMDRAAKMARTYLQKASHFLHAAADPRSRIGKRYMPVVYWDLLDQALDTALDIVEALPNDFFEMTTYEDIFGFGIGTTKGNSSDEPLERAAKVVAAIERRRGDANRQRKIAALENVEGRTPEEAEAYRAAAERLRASR